MFPKQALSIGINAYVPSRLTLQPCINDATDFTNALRSIGFKVRCETDLNLDSMKSVTNRFIDSIQPGSVAVFYFSGHGVQANGRNYLIASNATGVCVDNIDSTAIDAQKLIDSMYTKRPRLIICILDCCRTMPPEEPLDGFNRYRKALAGTRAGFAPMQGPPSTIIVYACAADDTASPRSKNGRNSLYTYHLLRYIRTPNVDIETILRRAAIDVQRESNNEQIPYRYSSCNEMISLNSSPRHKVVMPPQYMQAVGAVPQPFNKRYKKGYNGYHLPAQYNNFQYPWAGQFGLPMNYYLGVQNQIHPMKNIPVNYAFPFPNQPRYYY